MLLGSQGNRQSLSPIITSSCLPSCSELDDPAGGPGEMAPKPRYLTSEVQVRIPEGKIRILKPGASRQFSKCKPLHVAAEEMFQLKIPNWTRSSLKFLPSDPNPTHTCAEVYQDMPRGWDGETTAVPFGCLGSRMVKFSICL